MVEADPSSVFRALFDGRTLAYGWSRGHDLGTLRGLTEAQYQHHLGGIGIDEDWSLGLAPVRDDGTVRFTGLDLDAKDLTDTEVHEVVRRASDLGLPLVWTLSRSRGLHGWLFLDEPTKPADVRRVLHAWGERLGWSVKSGGASKERGDRFFEVFPKQEWIAPDKAGNWIRLPWPGGQKAMCRRGVWLLEQPPTFAQWLAFALQLRVSQAQLDEFLREVGPAPMPSVPRKTSRATAVIPPHDASVDIPLGSLRDPNVTLADVRRWLGQLGEDYYGPYESSVKVLMALHHQFAETPQEAGALALEWSQQSTKYEDGAVEAKWSSFGTADSSNEITIRSLRHWAGENYVAEFDDDNEQELRARALRRQFDPLRPT